MPQPARRERYYALNRESPTRGDNDAVLPPGERREPEVRRLRAVFLVLCASRTAHTGGFAPGRRAGSQVSALGRRSARRVASAHELAAQRGHA